MPLEHMLEIGGEIGDACEETSACGVVFLLPTRRLSALPLSLAGIGPYRSFLPPQPLSLHSYKTHKKLSRFIVAQESLPRNAPCQICSTIFFF